VAVRTSTSSWQRAFLIPGSIILAVAALYFARSVLIPVVLAILLAFVLNPLVAALQRRGAPRVLAVTLVIVLGLAAVGGVGFVVVSQVRNLALDLPRHKDEIAEKLRHLREASHGSWIDRVVDSVKEIETLVVGEETEPLPVRVVSSGYPILQSLAAPAAEILVTIVLVVALVAFMLIKREDLRNRVIRLWGHGGLTSMTRALDDATSRISRFLLRQLLINAGFGVSIAVGLYFIGVPYPALWGFLGTCLRYVPYIGAWVAAAFPLLLSIIVLPGWTPPIMVFGLFLVLELVISNIIEPLVYGQSIGVSEVALLIAAAFWTWLWGPIGLVLSAPLTACLAVLGRYVPNLEFLNVLLGDEPVLEPFASYYQRLLARDQDEAADLIEAYAHSHNSEDVFDDVLVPALTLARRNRQRGQLSRADMDFIRDATAELLDEVWLPQPDVHAEAAEDQITVFGCPARDELDELVLEMLRHLLDPARCRFEVLSPDALTAEVLAKVRAEQAPVVCIGTLPPQSLAHSRYLCKRLRGRFPQLKIVVGCWGWDGDRSMIEASLKDAGADSVATSLREARSQLVPLVQVLQHVEARAAAGLAQQAVR
jgi:predicted PurR-regulated permease PerM